MSDIDLNLILVAVLSSTVRLSTPIVLGALGGIFSERSGVVNIAIEGLMLTAAFVGFLIGASTGNVWLGVVAAVATGALMALLHGVLSIHLRVDQIISGTVINILAVGLTGYFYTSSVTLPGKLPSLPIPLLSELPIVGPVLFDNPPITYLALILVAVTHVVLYRTQWGLRLRAVGENPRAADTVGVNVIATRYANVMIGGALAGLAGAFLSLEAVGSFERLMTNGRGFIALAAMIFGNWNPIGAWAAALLFGFANALQSQLQFLGLGSIIPHQFIGLLPYVLTIVVLAGFVGRARPPAAVGQPYSKE
ncbi:MAG TPA: ABC transporter permease [Anaerolineales bacterium]|nr:ABC transporter permease [Anaerolineales bacterium]